MLSRSGYLREIYPAFGVLIFSFALLLAKSAATQEAQAQKQKVQRSVSGATGGSSASGTPVYGYRLVATYPHSTESYTEGLFYLDGIFYESIGMNGHSAVMAIAPETGRVLLRHDLPAEYFGEGIIDWGSNVYQWTWKSHAGFVYDRFTLRV